MRTLVMVMLVISGGGMGNVSVYSEVKKEALNGGVQEAAVITDKTEYVRGEDISYVVRNNRSTSMWFPSDFIRGYFGKPSISVKKKKANGWVEYYAPCVPKGTLLEPPDPIEIKPKEERNFTWNQFLCNKDTNEDELAASGTYRIKFPYSQEMNIKFRKKVYSNEFKIKQSLSLR